MGQDDLIKLMNDVKRRGEENPRLGASEMVKFIKERLRGKLENTKCDEK